MKNHLLTWLVLAAIVAGMFAAALPNNVQAATQCKTVHVVAAGESVNSIAKLYGVNAQALARLNELRTGTPLRVGQKLCIPSTGKADPNLTLTAYAKGGQIVITATNDNREKQYVVKVREGDFGKWYKLGKMVSGAKGNSSTATFAVPTALKKKLYLTVCLKNQSSNALTCKAMLNVP